VIWLAWRQHRADALVVAGGLALAVIGLAWLEISMSGAISQLGLGRCTNMQTQACLQLANTFENWFPAVRPVLLFFVAIPLLLGMFVGAPLVAREVEQRTHWLVWAQSVGRSRWLLVQVAGVLLLGVVAMTVLTLAVNWAVAPLLQVFIQARQTNQLDQPWFDVIGAVPVAYTVFALALGISTGALLPRTLPAMLMVLGIFLVMRLSVASFRADYQPPITVHQTVTSNENLAEANMRLTARDPAGAWVTGSWITDRNSRIVSGVVDCGPTTGRSCLGYTRWITYQPADRYWPFQAIESGIYLALSTLLLALTAYWVRRRVA
jgi:hypothetical protein